MVDQNRKEELSVDSLQDAVDSLQGAVDRFREDALKGFRRCIQMLYRQYDPDEVNAALNQYIQAHKKENEEPKNE